MTCYPLFKNTKKKIQLETSELLDPSQGEQG
jgi:hypothetical protein